MSVVRAFAGQTLVARALRSSAFTMGGFVGGQAIRLASNLILTRMLFPEAFGVMAMITVLLMGLAMFSDVGVGPSIMASKRGDDRAFLDTAWTIQIGRGVILWIAACALAWPAAQWFGEPDLTTFIPVAALTLIIAGFNPTALHQMNRHMKAGRLVLIELSQALIGTLVAVLLALWLQSVWALVISGLVAMSANLMFLRLFLPNSHNRLRWEPAAAQELIHFGKWIFLSTVCGFAVSQGDKIIIGGYLGTGDFGIYNVGFFLASFPWLMGMVVTQRLLIPLYRESPPAESRENYMRLRKMRIVATAGLLGATLGLSFLGVWIVQLLYDPRYYLAGGIVVLLAAMQGPAIIGITYDQAALAAGRSRDFFALTLVRAVCILAFMSLGVALFGLGGALIGQGLAWLVTWPVMVWLARKQGAWDPLHDAGFLAVWVAVAGLALWVNQDAVASLWAVMPG